MWQTMVRFLAEWARRPTGPATLGMLLGFLLFLVGMIWHNRRQKIFGLATIGLSLVAGIVRYLYG